MTYSALKNIFRKSELQFLKKENPCEDYYVFDFVCENAKSWKAGDCGVFSIANKKIQGKKSRIFSIVSIPDEKIITVAMRITHDPSAFKQHLLTLEPKSTLSLRGPFGFFHIKDMLSPIIMIAGGIGITPFMAFLKEMKKENKRDVHLLYSAKQQHLFKDEIENIRSSINACTVAFIQSREALLDALDAKIQRYQSSGFFYISGKKAMIKTIKKHLKDAKVPRKRILTDSFGAYTSAP